MKEVYSDCCYTPFPEIELKGENGNLDMNCPHCKEIECHFCGSKGNLMVIEVD